MNQEQLTEAADVSVGTVRKVEQGGDVRMETLHALARALGVSTSTLFATETTTPVVGDEANRGYLVELRKALMPPVGLAAPMTDRGGAEELSALPQRHGRRSRPLLGRSVRFGGEAASGPAAFRRSDG
ncbi:helix-turn-helix domain-containing protein [Streptomyces halobius]|uniref:Helix-turn-helix domain-containing protein n=1 Tax=Streptomyces halobius TaxID=2879846 RepID=A0ABY4LZR7_9ACTN|nr:helix-turn-helix domain-containing protein [Streptomyces halobius]